MKKLLAASALALVLSAPLALQAAPEGGPGHKRMEAVLEKLPPAKAEAFKASMKAEREANKSKRDEIRKLHDELNVITTAPTFDKAAFLAKHKEIGAIRTEISEGRNEALADALSKLTQEERKAVSEGFKRKGPKHGGPDAKAE